MPTATAAFLQVLAPFVRMRSDPSENSSVPPDGLSQSAYGHTDNNTGRRRKRESGEHIIIIDPQ